MEKNVVINFQHLFPLVDELPIPTFANASFAWSIDVASHALS
jgi:hypothetical protein